MSSFGLGGLGEGWWIIASKRRFGSPEMPAHHSRTSPAAAVEKTFQGRPKTFTAESKFAAAKPSQKIHLPMIREIRSLHLHDLSIRLKRIRRLHRGLTKNRPTSPPPHVNVARLLPLLRREAGDLQHLGTSGLVVGRALARRRTVNTPSAEVETDILRLQCWMVTGCGMGSKKQEAP